MNNKWDIRFLKLAHEVADWSKDDSTKVGAVIVAPDKTPRSFGYNGFPENVDDTIPERNQRPLKYKYSEHAERNAIYHCSKNGIAINNCYMYVTHFPCADCGRAIVRNGIKKVIIDKKSFENSFNDRWEEDGEISKSMMEEAGIKIIIIDLGHT